MNEVLGYGFDLFLGCTRQAQFLDACNGGGIGGSLQLALDMDHHHIVNGDSDYGKHGGSTEGRNRGNRTTAVSGKHADKAEHGLQAAFWLPFVSAGK